jgi:hypothetical protein
MSVRTSLASIEESGWSFTVVREEYRDIELLADEWLDAERDSAVENMKLAQRLARDEWKKTLGRQAAQPSRANQPPRKISGALQRGVKLGRRRWKTRDGRNTSKRRGLLLEGRVQNTHPAAGPLEFGAIRRLGFGPRPHWRPTLRRIADELGDILAGVR